jgi:hypothetical protein
MKSEKDYLARAARKLLKPLLEDHGFQMFTLRTFMRLKGKIAQYLCLQKSAWGGGDFCVKIHSLDPTCPASLQGTGSGTKTAVKLR